MLNALYYLEDMTIQGLVQVPLVPLVLYFHY